MNPKKSRGATEKLRKSISILTDASPKNQEFQPESAILSEKPENPLIERLLKLHPLNGWESLFLREIKKTKTLGTKQREKLALIAARRLRPETEQMQLPLELEEGGK